MTSRHIKPNIRPTKAVEAESGISNDNIGDSALAAATTMTANTTSYVWADLTVKTPLSSFRFYAAPYRPGH